MSFILRQYIKNNVLVKLVKYKDIKPLRIMMKVWDL